MNQEEIKKILPHRDNMLLVEESEVVDDVTARGRYTIKGDEFFLQGHFPGNPIVPGVIQCEMMAQSACILFADKMREEGALPVYAGLDKVKFRNMIKPGDLIRIDTKLVRSLPPMYSLHGELSVDGKVCMNGDFSCVIVRKEQQ